jgi:hypothetical protein
MKIPLKGTKTFPFYEFSAKQPQLVASERDRRRTNAASDWQIMSQIEMR